MDFEKPPPDTAMVEGTMWTVMGDARRKATGTLRVSEVWKGARQQTMTITTEADSSVGCGYPFEEGREYLVYATAGEPSVGLCGDTKPLSEARADLEALGEGQTPDDGSALTDTSGGVSVRAMAGLTGLVMTVSLLLAMRILNAG